MITIVNATAAPETDVETFLDICFGPGRFAKTAYRLREGVAADDALSLMALEGGALRGTLQFWPIRIGETWDALMLGPLAVDPNHRGKGIGIDLMRQGLDLARGLDHERVMLVGDEKYYARVGFSKTLGRNLRMPGPVDPARLLACELAPGAMDGVAGMVERAL